MCWMFSLRLSSDPRTSRDVTLSSDLRGFLQARDGQALGVALDAAWMGRLHSAGITLTAWLGHLNSNLYIE